MPRILAGGKCRECGDQRQRNHVCDPVNLLVKDLRKLQDTWSNQIEAMLDKANEFYKVSDTTEDEGKSRSAMVNYQCVLRGHTVAISKLSDLNEILKTFEDRLLAKAKGKH